LKLKSTAKKADSVAKKDRGQKRSAASYACKFYAALILGALNGRSKEELLSPGFYQGSLVPEIAEVAAGSFKQKNPPAIAGTGYVVKSLEAALWVFYRSDTFEKGALLAANLGDDADTTAAVFGQLGGAFYGVDAIPAKWLAKLAMRELIEQMADDLLSLSALTAEEEMEKKAAAMYGFDNEGERRREAGFKEEIRRRWEAGI
jgi:ADP-ribosyl-[dinitrogen reductase] hydrolase